MGGEGPLRASLFILFLILTLILTLTLTLTLMRNTNTSTTIREEQTTIVQRMRSFHDCSGEDAEQEEIDKALFFAGWREVGGAEGTFEML